MSSGNVTRGFINYLKNEMKASEDLIANAIVTAGIDSYTSFADFDDDEIKNLCSTLRKPGG